MPDSIGGPGGGGSGPAFGDGAGCGTFTVLVPAAVMVVAALVAVMLARHIDILVVVNIAHSSLHELQHLRVCR